ncbi:hypothetical protein LJC56_11010 [Christensenellaceae bacterium OttesenSCG-928-K19]|nr:hypothetical protein [Christensenellaceae bacterium OttesenSCG-928-K19]
MDNTKLTEKVMEHEKVIAKQGSEIKTLFENQKSIKDLTESTHSLATVVNVLVEKFGLTPISTPEQDLAAIMNK